MQSNIQREPVLHRFLPLMLMALGAFHLVDWAYIRFSDPWKLVNGAGLLLMGGAHFAAIRLKVASAPGRGRNALLALGIVGATLAISAMVHSWL